MCIITIQEVFMVLLISHCHMTKVSVASRGFTRLWVYNIWWGWTYGCHFLKKSSQTFLIYLLVVHHFHSDWIKHFLKLFRFILCKMYVATWMWLWMLHYCSHNYKHNSWWPKKHVERWMYSKWLLSHPSSHLWILWFLPNGAVVVTCLTSVGSLTQNTLWLC